jgi:hypothetical protein
MLRLLSTLLFCAAALVGYSQITTVGIIGTATPGGWDNDTDMVQDAADTAKWTLTITLVNGAAKFRANNAWDVNWGALDFPIGTGTQGGADISVPAGTYNISFNSVTGAYFFDLVSDIGVIGSATPFRLGPRSVHVPERYGYQPVLHYTQPVTGSGQIPRQRRLGYQLGRYGFSFGHRHAGRR